MGYSIRLIKLGSFVNTTDEKHFLKISYIAKKMVVEKLLNCIKQLPALSHQNLLFIVKQNMLGKARYKLNLRSISTLIWL